MRFNKRTQTSIKISILYQMLQQQQQQQSTLNKLYDI